PSPEHPHRRRRPAGPHAPARAAAARIGRAYAPHRRIAFAVDAVLRYRSCALQDAVTTAQESDMGLKGSKTEQNLKDAFAGESQANRRYLYFATKADIEGQNDVAALDRKSTRLNSS